MAAKLTLTLEARVLDLGGVMAARPVI